MAERKKKPAAGKPKDDSRSKHMVRLTEEEHTMLKALADKNDRKIVAELRIALRNHFRTAGMLPPATPT
jgi:hypothetical protein